MLYEYTVVFVCSSVFLLNQKTTSPQRKPTEDWPFQNSNISSTRQKKTRGFPLLTSSHLRYDAKEKTTTKNDHLYPMKPFSFSSEVIPQHDDAGFLLLGEGKPLLPTAPGGPRCRGCWDPRPAPARGAPRPGPRAAPA